MTDFVDDDIIVDDPDDPETFSEYAEDILAEPEEYVEEPPDGSIDALSDDDLEMFGDLVLDETFTGLDGLSLAVEEPPEKIVRPRLVKVEVPWESYLLFLRKTPGKTVRLFEFTGDEAKKRASQRARSMRSRLSKTLPHELFTVDSVDMKNGHYRVYARYDRKAMAEEIARRKEIAEGRIARGHHAADARKVSRAAAKAAPVKKAAAHK